MLNPVRAGMVRSADDWARSSHHGALGVARSPGWLSTDWLLGQFGSSRSDARARYRQFVAEGIGRASPLMDVRHRLMLGDERFTASRSKEVRLAPTPGEVARAQRRVLARSLDEYAAMHADRDEAMAMAYQSTVFSMAQIAAHFGVSVKTVSRAVAFHLRLA